MQSGIIPFQCGRLRYKIKVLGNRSSPMVTGLHFTTLVKSKLKHEKLLIKVVQH